MKILFDRKRFTFYLWVGVAYLSLWLFQDSISERDTFFPERFLNNIWRAIYITIINFIFFEYTLPFIRRKRKNILVKILLSLFVLWVQLMLYSFGLYAWRYIGIQLGFYMSLRTDPSITAGV